MRVEHVRDSGKFGTVLERDLGEGGLLIGALVLWDDYPEPEYHWGSKLSLVASEDQLLAAGVADNDCGEGRAV